MPEFHQESEVPASAETVYAWHTRAGAFERLTPPWERIRLISSNGVSPGSRAVIRLSLGPFWRTWVAEHGNIQPGEAFQDVQISGPFSRWVHRHGMCALNAERSLLKDDIEYELPLKPVMNWLVGRLVRRQLDQTFAYRHRVTRQDIEFHQRAAGGRVMKIAVGGSTGMVGNELVAFLSTGGHEVIRLVRGRPSAASVYPQVAWNPAQGTIEATGLEGCDAVVHLGGDNISKGRWTAGKKRLIRDSRVESTRLLASTLASLSKPPAVFVCASAIGYYGDRGDELLTESSPPGTRFLSDVCQQWEAATAPAREAGIRVVNLRIGVVLSPKDGALKKMLLPFKLGAGGIVGSGRQWWSWIAIDDLIRAILHAVVTESLAGPVNAVAPEVVDNRRFTHVLGRVLRRPTIAPLPAPVVRLVFGEMGEELLLGSTRVVPQKLEASGFQFAYPELEPALRHLLGR